MLVFGGKASCNINWPLCLAGLWDAEGFLRRGREPPLLQRQFADQLLNMCMFGIHHVFHSCLWHLPSLTWAARAAKTCVSKARGGETPFAKPEMITISGPRPFPGSKGLPIAQFLLLVSTLKSTEWMPVPFHWE